MSNLLQGQKRQLDELAAVDAKQKTESTTLLLNNNLVEELN